MKVDERQILDASREVWTTVLGLQVESDPSPATGEGTGRVLLSRVGVSGAWEGAIVVECDESIARHAAAMLFDTDAQSADSDDLADALDELADMVGRRVGRLLPEETKFSRPRRTDAETLASSALRDLTEVRLRCEGRAVRIKLFEATPQLAEAGAGATVKAGA